MNPFVLLMLAVASELVATASLRASEGFTRWIPSTLVVVGYGIAFYLLSLTLKQIPLGTAYAIWSGVGTVGTAIIGVWLFRESLGWVQIAGIGFVVLGVVLLNVVSKGHA